MPETAALVVDGRGLTCVSLLLRLRAHLRDVAGGAVVQIVTTDPAASLDLPAWCHLTGHRYLGSRSEPDLAVHSLRVAESPAPTDDRHPWRPTR